VRFLGVDELYPNFETAAVYYSEKFIKERPEDAKKFMRAFLRGARDYNDALDGDRLTAPAAADVIPILTEYSFIKNPDVYRAMRSHYVDPNGELNVKSLKDFSDKDRIAVPGIKTSLPAVMLHMVAAKEFGDANYAKLDPITVGLPHPDALGVLLSGRGEINSHMASPPFSYIEDATPGLHRVLNTVDVLGDITVDMTYTTRRFFEANPKLCAAFIAAMSEANALIAKDSKKAAQIYLAVSKQKSTADEIIRILADPNSKFSTVPNGTMKYAEFMSRVGTIKAKPATWKDLFFAPMHGAAGS